MPDYPLIKDKTILVVDDEPDVLDTLKDLLADCAVVTAGSFEEARELLEARPFWISWALPDTTCWRSPAEKRS
jgi:DNA-binding NtrC family response regulator